MKLIDELREHYRRKEYDELRRKYKLGLWMLTSEERKKIGDVIDNLPRNIPQDIVDFVNETEGWRWTD